MARFGSGHTSGNELEYESLSSAHKKKRGSAYSKHYEDDNCTLDITIPPSSASSFSQSGRLKPQADLLINYDNSEDINLKVPVDVAKKLIKYLKDAKLPLDLRDFNALLQKLLLSSASQKLTALVSLRDYSRDEAASRLKVYGFPDEVIYDVLDRALSGKLIDDNRFAETFIRSKIASGWGMLKIERELRNRGIKLESVKGWPDDFEIEDEDTRAFELLKYRAIPAKNPYEKMVRFLVGKGYSYDVSKRCVKKLLDSFDDNE